MVKPAKPAIPYACLLLAALLSACGDNSHPSLNPDSGPARDAIPVMDSGLARDVTPIIDSGPVRDAPPLIDSGPAPDAIPTIDSPSTPDLAPNLDTSLPVDAPDRDVFTPDAPLGFDASPMLDADLSPDASPNPDLSLTPAGVLAALGVKTDLGMRLGPDNKELPSTYHPLSRRVLSPLAEVYFGVKSSAATFGGVLDDDKNSALQPVYAEEVANVSYLYYPFRASKGDVDGDGRDEIVIVFWNSDAKSIGVQIVERENGQYTTRIVAAVPNVLQQYVHPELQASLAVGDLDQDGRDEIAFAIFNTVYIFDDAKAGYVLLATKSLQNQDPLLPLAMIRLGIGTFTTDGKQRLFAMVAHADAQLSGSGGWGEAHLFDDAQLSKTVYDSEASTAIKTLQSLGIGDVDGDHLDEIVFNGTDGRDVQGLGVLKFGEDPAGLTTLAAATAAATSAILLDYDGDGIKEILDGKRLYRFVSSGLGAPPMLVPIDEDVPTIPPNANVGVGDINGDLNDELLVPTPDGIAVLGKEPGGTGLAVIKAIPGTPATQAGTAVAANLDDDSLTLDYTGRWELRFTNPTIVAVMAAPPTLQGIDQQDSFTTFGQTSGSTAEIETSLGITTGFSVGAGVAFEALGIGGQASVELAVKGALNVIAARSSTIQTFHSFTCGASEDRVVFMAVPVDVFYYKVLAAADPAVVGTIVTISLPRTATTLSAPRTYFNEHNGDQPDVGPEVLGHTIGYPFTYPTEAQRDQQLAVAAARFQSKLPSDEWWGGWKSPTTISVGPGGAGSFETLRIEYTESDRKATALELSATVTAEVSGGVIVQGSGSISAGVQGGVSLSTTVTKGFFVEGQIGAIPEQQFSAEKRYVAGLYTHPKESGGQKFMVVNYWVTR